MKKQTGVWAVFLAALFFLSAVQPGNLSAMGKRPKLFTITMKVDFGPAGKPAYVGEKFYVEKGTTAKEAVSQVFPILSGRVCCSLHDLLSIDGVKIDPAKNRWWMCLLNGSTKFSPHEKKLKPGDVVEWKYIQDGQ